jgi:hypothetical protein
MDEDAHDRLKILLVNPFILNVDEPGSPISPTKHRVPQESYENGAKIINPWHPRWLLLHRINKLGKSTTLLR